MVALLQLAVLPALKFTQYPHHPVTFHTETYIFDVQYYFINHDIRRWEFSTEQILCSQHPWNITWSRQVHCQQAEWFISSFAQVNKLVFKNHRRGEIRACSNNLSSNSFILQVCGASTSNLRSCDFVENPAHAQGVALISSTLYNSRSLFRHPIG